MCTEKPTSTGQSSDIRQCVMALDRNVVEAILSSTRSFVHRWTDQEIDQIESLNNYDDQISPYPANDVSKLAAPHAPMRTWRAREWSCAADLASRRRRLWTAIDFGQQSQQKTSWTCRGHIAATLLRRLCFSTLHVAFPNHTRWHYPMINATLGYRRKGTPHVTPFRWMNPNTTLFWPLVFVTLSSFHAIQDKKKAQCATLVTHSDLSSVLNANNICLDCWSITSIISKLHAELFSLSESAP